MNKHIIECSLEGKKVVKSNHPVFTRVLCLLGISFPPPQIEMELCIRGSMCACVPACMRGAYVHAFTCEHMRIFVEILTLVLKRKWPSVGTGRVKH